MNFFTRVSNTFIYWTQIHFPTILEQINKSIAWKSNQLNYDRSCPLYHIWLIWLIFVNKLSVLTRKDITFKNKYLLCKEKAFLIIKPWTYWSISVTVLRSIKKCKILHYQLLKWLLLLNTICSQHAWLTHYEITNVVYWFI